MTQAQRDYAAFLDTPFWHDISSRKKELAGWKCEKCGRDHHLQSHHIRYRSKWTDTLLDDLVCLCRGCHKAAHGIVNQSKKLKRSHNEERTYRPGQIPADPNSKRQKKKARQAARRKRKMAWRWARKKNRDKKKVEAKKETCSKLAEVLIQNLNLVKIDGQWVHRTS